VGRSGTAPPQVNVPLGALQRAFWYIHDSGHGLPVTPVTGESRWRPRAAPRLPDGGILHDLGT
jgi:hypothetical protein